MFPIRDDNPTQTAPILTLALIAACAGVWIRVQGAGSDPGLLHRSVCAFGYIPTDVTGLGPSVRVPEEYGCGGGGAGWWGIPASLFLHGSWMHLIGNMWFLWIFGNNIEDAMGRVRFLVFYLLAGTAAAAAQTFTDPGSPLPMVGASGAISGVMGAYLVLFPRARITMAFILLVFVRILHLPAWLMLGYWFLLQFASAALQPPGSGGVAFAAHAGGFAAGVVLVRLFTKDPRPKARTPRVGTVRGRSG